jgi:RHS repeat-associated protein
VLCRQGVCLRLRLRVQRARRCGLGRSARFGSTLDQATARCAGETCKPNCLLFIANKEVIKNKWVLSSMMSILGSSGRFCVVLHAPIRVMHQSGPRSSSCQSHAERLQREGGFEHRLQGPADHPSGKGVQNHGQVDELQLQADVSDVGNPELMETGQRQRARQVGIHRQAVRRYTKSSVPSRTASADNRATYTFTTIRGTDHEGREDAYENNCSGNTATDLLGSDRSFAGAAATAITSGRELGYVDGVSGNGYDRDIWLAGRMIAQSYTTETYFLHHNVLGSDMMMTNHAANPTLDILYYPLGAEWTYTGSQIDSHFAGFQLSGSNLNGTPARFYSNPQGRWLTPDPGGKNVVDMLNPQTWNMYAYVRNNPTTLTDPSGLYLMNPGSLSAIQAGEEGIAAENEGVYLANLAETQSGGATQAASNSPTDKAQQQEMATGSNGVTTIHHADGSIETRTGGSAAWRNHNPGNEASGYGAIGTAHININGKMHNFAIYPNDETGWKALDSNLHSLYWDRSIAATMGLFAPASDGNNPVAYANALSTVGVPASTKLSGLSPAQLNTFEQRISIQEGFSIHGTSTILIPQ